MSEPVVLFPDAVELVIGAINDGYADADIDTPVDNAVPDPRPDEFIVVRRQGGPRVNLTTDSAQIRVECYAQTRARAHDLAQYARAYVLAMRGTVRAGVSIYKIEEFGGPAELPDPITQLPRYIFTELVHTRGTGIDTPPNTSGPGEGVGQSRRAGVLYGGFLFLPGLPQLFPLDTSAPDDDGRCASLTSLTTVASLSVGTSVGVLGSGVQVPAFDTGDITAGQIITAVQSVDGAEQIVLTPDEDHLGMSLGPGVYSAADLGLVALVTSGTHLSYNAETQQIESSSADPQICLLTFAVSLSYSHDLA